MRPYYIIDHERIPERVVHARGVGAHGYFETYKDWSNLTAAKFLRDTDKKTPVFVRFSTVLGSRGSADTVRDVRGFATRFYTDEGNFDLGKQVTMSGMYRLLTIFCFTSGKCNRTLLCTRCYEVPRPYPFWKT